MKSRLRDHRPGGWPSFKDMGASEKPSEVVKPAEVASTGPHTAAATVAANEPEEEDAISQLDAVAPETVAAPEETRITGAFQVKYETQHSGQKELASAIIKVLKKKYPAPECALKHENPWQLLVATILSAQCTDKRVNMVTPDLFKRFATIEDFAKAGQEELEELDQIDWVFPQQGQKISLPVLGL